MDKDDDSDRPTVELAELRLRTLRAYAGAKMLPESQQVQRAVRLQKLGVSAFDCDVLALVAPPSTTTLLAPTKRPRGEENKDERER